MQRIASIITAIGLALASVQTSAAIATTPDKSPNDSTSSRQAYAHHPNTLLVKMKPNAARLSAPGIVSSRAFRVPELLNDHEITRWRVIKVPAGNALESVRQNLLRNPNVETVEFNYEVKADLTPNDPRFAELWGLHNIGQTGGTADSDIDAPEAWDRAVTKWSGTVVAVIDTGIDYTHPDLAANIWTNSGEIAGNGIDDDGNGYVDDIHGYDFAYNDADPMDAYGHGTHVSGTIAAVRNNGIGVSGIAPDVKLMAVKFLNDSGSGYTSDAVDALMYSIDMGAYLSNNSWGGGGYSQALYDAISAAEAADSLFVAAAGNGYGSDNDTTPHYPSSYDNPNIIAVASTDHNDNLSSFSNIGATSVDLAAPGSSILSTIPGGGYTTYNGTSMATPHVTGAAALLLSGAPNLSYQELRNRIMETVDPLPSLDGLMVSGGRLNLNKAVPPEYFYKFYAQNVNVNHTASTFPYGTQYPYNFSEPVVIAGPSTYDGTNPGVVRLSNVTGSTFDIRFGEWMYLDGTHMYEDMSIIAFEAGHRIMPGTDATLEAGIARSVTSVNNYTIARHIAFQKPFTFVPYVFTSSQTINGNPITVRVANVTTTGFDIYLQEEEADRTTGHTTAEDIGYIALEPTMSSSAYPWVNNYAVMEGKTGEWLGWSFGFYFGEVSMDEQWEPVETAAGTFNYKVNEETSYDTETGHAKENVQILYLRTSTETIMLMQDNSYTGSDVYSIRRQ